jgi:exodeoxyribonuclease VII large subunit
MKRLQEEDIEVLVLVRGGGSHESLQAFNNEHVVRAIAGFPVPVICAIGHHEDIPLAQLAADIAPSTPTACAITINERWESALSEMEHAVQTALLLYQETLGIAREEIRKQEDAVARAITKLIHSVKDAESCVRNLVEKFALTLTRTSTYLDALPLSLIQSFMSYIRVTKKEVGDLARMVMARDPRRLLASGYAFALKDGKLLRSVRAVGIGDAFQVRVSDGRIDSTVTRTEPQEL